MAAYDCIYATSPQLAFLQLIYYPCLLTSFFVLLSCVNAPNYFNCYSKVNNLSPPSKWFENLKACNPSCLLTNKLYTKCDPLFATPSHTIHPPPSVIYYPHGPKLLYQYHYCPQRLLCPSRCGGHFTGTSRHRYIRMYHRFY